MKKICLLLGVILLFQSCVSYKKVEANPKTMVIGEQYKITRNDKTSKAIYITNADSAIVVMRNGVQEQIPVKNITEVRQRKFSLAKTTGCFILGLFGFTALLVYGAENTNGE